MKKIGININNDLENWNEPLTKEQLEKIIYNIFCVVIFITPVFSDIIGFGIYSLKSTIFNLTTIATSLALLGINRKNLKMNIYDILLSIYLLLVVFSTVFTKQGIVQCILGTNGRGEGLLTIFSYVATFIIFSRGYKYMSNVSKVAIISAIVVSVYSLIQANIPLDIKIPLVPKSRYGVANGTMGNQNFLSSYICIFLPMTCFYCINCANKQKRSVIIATMLFLSLVFSVTLGRIYYIYIYVFGCLFVFSNIF